MDGCTFFWSIWKHRNVKVWEDITETCATMVERFRSMVEDWKHVNVPCASGKVAPTADHITTTTHATPAVTAAVQVCWQPPAQGRMKCNIDAAFSNHRNRTDIGICLQDKGGVFILTKTINFVGVYSVDIGEALGLFHALQSVSDMQLDNIDFEVDSKTTKYVVYSGRENISELGNIIRLPEFFSLPSSTTLGWSFPGDKQMWLLILSHKLVLLFIFIYLIVLKL